jgi:hypothetical protein
MDLEQLQTEWRERDQHLERLMRINNDLLRNNLIEQHQREIRRLGLLDRYEILTGLPIFIFLVWFIAKHTQQWQFLLPAFILLAWTIALPTLNYQSRHRLHALDFGLPMTVLQTELSYLKAYRLRLLKWALLVGQLIWHIPFLIVFLKGMFGVDLYQVSENFIVPSLIGGTLFIPFALLVGRYLSPRLQTMSWFQRLIDLLAGKDIAQSQLFLNKIDRFRETSVSE